MSLRSRRRSGQLRSTIRFSRLVQQLKLKTLRHYSSFLAGPALLSSEKLQILKRGRAAFARLLYEEKLGEMMELPTT